MKSRHKKFFGVGALIAGLVSCVIGLWLLLSPAQYQATIQVQVGRDDPNVYNPYFIQSEFEIVRSGVVLSNVVEKLNLLKNWDGQENTMGAAIHQLKRRTTVQPARNVAWVMEIRVVDKNPETAARIANAIAGSYCDYRIEQNRLEKIRGLKIMEDEYQKEATDIKVQRERLDGLRKQLNLTNQESTESMIESGYPAYVQAKSALTNREAIHQYREAIIAGAKSADNSRAALASELGTRIVNPAAPPSTPIGPNRLLGLAWLVCGLVVSVSGCCLISTSGTKTKTIP
jgi:uncharacterized protein involved in exopolysaccharide biosynthesis